MATRNSLALALAAVLFVPRPAHAAAAPAAAPVVAPDPCANAAELTTRDKILAAIPENDESWAEALNRRGLKKEENGWMQYFQSGSATASNRAFIVAFEDYCTARARAATAQKRPRPTPVVTQIPRPVETEAKATEAAKARIAKNTSFANNLKAMFTPAEQAAPPPPSAAECASLRAQADTCDAADIDVGKLGSEIRCRNARARAAACPR